MSNYLNIARQYLSALEQKVDSNSLAQFFCDDVIQREFPNRLVPNGQTRNLTEILTGHERGKHVMTSQHYEVTNAIESGTTVMVEVRWTGLLAQAVGSLAAGDSMSARFAVVLEFRDGKIVAQRNYDCFDPW